ncbi:MAG: M48 family metallopeptidase [Proteobacteria bacterium]|nr:M48 family metallopeptidase [Pseudomonadota bacterium]
MNRQPSPTLPPGVKLRVSARARRVSLKVDAAQGIVELVVPKTTSLTRAAQFAHTNRRWIQGRLARLPPAVPFVSGASIPVFGVPYRVRHFVNGRGTVAIVEDEIHVAGHTEHLPRRLGDWLKAEARRRIVPIARRMAERIGKTPRRIRVDDTTSRWGSCSPKGDLMFSWRLILAPERVLVYVVAHEVAHLVHLNHGKRFWRLVESMVPSYEEQRLWLAQNGPGLHRYG